jgi:hypothetical protein
MIFCGHPLGSHPHEVTVHFRGLRPAGVSPWLVRRPRFALTAPPVIDDAGYLPVFRPTCLPVHRSFLAPLLWLRPLKGTTHPARRSAFCARQKAFQQLSWSFLPLRRLSLSKSTSSRFASPGSVPSPGFLTLSTVYSSPRRPTIFRLVTPMGFRSPRVFPHHQVPWAHRHHGIALLAFFPRCPTQDFRALRRLTQEPRICSSLFRLQDFAPIVDPYCQQRLLDLVDSRSLLELSPL